MPTEVLTLDINPTPFFVPPHVGGDREFKGHGPDSASIGKVSRCAISRELWATVYMHAKETQARLDRGRGNRRVLGLQTPWNQTNRSNTLGPALICEATPIRTTLLISSIGPLVNWSGSLNVSAIPGAMKPGIRTGVRAHFNPIKIEVETKRYRVIKRSK